MSQRASDSQVDRGGGVISVDQENVRPAVREQAVANTLNANQRQAAVTASREIAQPVSFARVETDGPIPADLCEPATVIARVGSEVILSAEVLGPVNEALAAYREKVPPAVYERYKQELMKQFLDRRIEIKLIYLDAKRNLPPEAMDHFEQELDKAFGEKELPERLKKLGLKTPQELDEQLHQVGSSLAAQKRVFIESVIAREWLRQQLEKETSGPVASPEELLAYYQSHGDEFREEGWVEWQQLMVRKRPDRPDAEAYARLAELGNRVLAGEPFEAVARSGSEGPTAATGGVRERTQRGSLRSKLLEEALFSLPPGAISPILEDEQGFHIVRVLRRKEPRQIPFSEAQVQIREKLENERRNEKSAAQLEKLRREIPVSTLFDLASNTPRDDQ